MAQHVLKAGPTPGGVDILRAEKSSHIAPSAGQHQGNQQQGNQKIGRCQAKITHQIGQGSGRTMAVKSGIDPQWNGHYPGGYQGKHRQEDRPTQPLPDQAGHRPVVEKRVTKIALQDAGQPVEVLSPDRLIQAVLLANQLDGFGADPGILEVVVEKTPRL